VARARAQNRGVVSENLRELLRYVADDFAAFPRLPIVLGIALATPACALLGAAVAGPAFALGLAAGLAWSWSPDDLPWL
jgi:hypothetical protein